MCRACVVFVQVEPPVARLLELDKIPSNVSYTPSRNRQWHMYNCRWVSAVSAGVPGGGR